MADDFVNDDTVEVDVIIDDDDDDTVVVDDDVDVVGHNQGNVASAARPKRNVPNNSGGSMLFVTSDFTTAKFVPYNAALINNNHRADVTGENVGILRISNTNDDDDSDNGCGGS